MSIFQKYFVNQINLFTFVSKFNAIKFYCIMVTKHFYPRHFYHTIADAREAATEAAGKDGIIKQGTTDAGRGFDYISRDALNDDRDGEVPAFLALDSNAKIVGVFAYNE